MPTLKAASATSPPLTPNRLPGACVTQKGMRLDLTVEKWKLDKDRFSEWADDPTPVWLIRAVSGETVVGWAEFYENWGTVENVQVHPGFRHQGVASALYDAIERHWKLKLDPSDNLEADGRGFWLSRDPDALRRRR